MVPFDGIFANSYALPLAEAAYTSTHQPTGFAQCWEIIADSNAVATALADAGSSVSPRQNAALLAMLRQPPAPAPPTAIAHKSSALAQTATPPNRHFGWICADTTNQRLCVAIRGSQFFEDWLKDFDFISVPYLPVPIKGCVHQGFQQVYYAIRQSILDGLDAARTAYPQLNLLFITGHSLGAAVAGLAAPDLIATHSAGLAPTVYTFAEPRVGHHDYHNFYNATVPVCYRINNVWDVVPHLPPVLALYEHEGQQLDIDSGFSLDIARNHEILTGYVPGMAAWVRNHTHSAAVTIQSSAAEHVFPVLVGVAP